MPTSKTKAIEEVGTIDAHGLSLEPPQGWEGRIFRRAEAGELPPAGAGALRAAGADELQASTMAGAAAPEGERSFPVVHVSTLALPPDVSDYGSDVVEDLGSGDALVVLKEFDPAEAAQPLFARQGMPRALSVDDFHPDTLQRRLDDQCGYQEFFHEAERAFSLYVVLGSYAQRARMVPDVNRVLGSLQIAPTLEE
jgi:hypothetical protein